MFSKLFVILQSLLPQHALSRLLGCVAEARAPWLKNQLIKQFMRHYPIEMHEAIEPNPYHYLTFNDFFTRQLRPDCRPIAADSHAIVSPVDGAVAMAGKIEHNQLLQAKGAYFDLAKLCGNDEAIAPLFVDGLFSTLYLAPHNYHRIHMPLTGKLIRTTYVPGRLFSVNATTTALVPQLYARNERLICLFETAAGKMAVILVGAMIVGSMQTVWMQAPIRAAEIQTEAFTDGPVLAKGEEMGLFKLGSTVILLFQSQQARWDEGLAAGNAVQYGQQIGIY